MKPFPDPLRRFAAWCVHAYTALGLVLASFIAIAVLQGSKDSFRLAFLLMLLATLIDATDGTLARWVRVKEVLPGFDGRRLDDLIDFLTYTCLPLLLLYRARIPSEGHEFWLLPALLASAYGFCQTAAKTMDGFFLGFPSYWNVIAFYLYVLEPGSVVSIFILIVFSALTFVPLRYVYPTQSGRLNRLTIALGVAWCVLLLCILWRLPREGASEPGVDGITLTLTLISLLYPAYYLIGSWLMNIRADQQQRGYKESSAKLPAPHETPDP
jgi:phosphatidylcholine synthase